MRTRILFILTIYELDYFFGFSKILWDMSLGNFINMDPEIEKYIYSQYTGLSSIFNLGVIMPLFFYVVIQIIFELILRLPKILQKEVSLTQLLLIHHNEYLEGK